MDTKPFGVAMRWLAPIAFVLVLAPVARGPAPASAIAVDQATADRTNPAPVVLAQGRCFNGRCF